MGKFLFAIIVTLGGVSAVSFANNVACTDPTGDWHLVVSEYQGGAPPPPEMTVYQRTWSYQGKAFEDINGSAAKPAATPDVVDTINVRNGHVLESHGNEMSGGVTYAQRVRLKRASGQPLVETFPNKTVEIYMICSENWIRNAP